MCMLMAESGVALSYVHPVMHRPAGCRVGYRRQLACWFCIFAWLYAWNACPHMHVTRSATACKCHSSQCACLPITANHNSATQCSKRAIADLIFDDICRHPCLSCMCTMGSSSPTPSAPAHCCLLAAFLRYVGMHTAVDVTAMHAAVLPLHG